MGRTELSVRVVASDDYTDSVNSGPELTKIPWIAIVPPYGNQITMPNMTSRKRAWLVYAITKDGSGDIEQKEVGHLYVVCGEEVEDYGLWGSRRPKLFLELPDYDGNETKPWVIANSYLRDNNRFCWYFIPGIYRDDYAFTGTHRGHSEDVTPYDVDLNVRAVPDNGDCQGTRPASHPATEWPFQPIIVAENNDETQEVTTQGLVTETNLVLPRA